ncbi:MAG: metal ABC transporter substrate-binding protein [Oligoflexia bacterium]|nr:metal ABC transporter substrate-binding protein [Oligoflexia bacterium]
MTALAERQPLQIGVSINPLVSVVAAIGGQAAQTSLLVPAITDPHTFELSPRQLRTIERSDLLVFVGLGLEFWARNFSASQRAKLFLLGKTLLEDNPHVWLDPTLLRSRLPELADRMCGLRPELCATFQRNLSTYQALLLQLDQELALEIKGWSKKNFVSYHPAWHYFAKHYGLTEIGELKRGHMSDISIQELQELLKRSHNSGASVFLIEPRGATQQVSEFATRLGFEVVEVDDLGLAGEDYISLMRRNVGALARVMK